MYRICLALVCVLSLISLSHPAPAATGGPDSAGYTWADSKPPAPQEPYSWIEIALQAGGPGQEIVPLTGQDNAVAQIPIGFDFSFYGRTFANVTVSTNGFLTFASSAAPSPDNRPIPQLTPQPHNLVAAFWDDLNLAHNPPVTPTPGVTPNPHAAVYYATQGTAPNRQLVVEWYQVPLASDPLSRLTFQAIISEATGNGDVKCQYSSMADSGSGGASGTSATLGIEGTNGWQGLQYSCNEAAVENSMAVRYSRTVAPGILVLQELCGSPAPRVVEALNALGYPYTATSDQDAFLADLTGGGPWSLVIIDSYSSCIDATLVAALDAYVTGGGKAIVCYWAWNPSLCGDSGTALAALFEATYASDYFAPVNLYRWEPEHPIFTTPYMIPDFTGGFVDPCDRDGAKFNATAGGETVAGYTTSAQADEHGIIVGNENRTILNGEVFDVLDQDTDGDGSPDVVKLIENEVVFLVPPTPTPTPSGPPVAAGIWTNAQFYRPKDIMVLQYWLLANVPIEELENVQADAYVALLGPKGLSWYLGQNNFSSSMAPIAQLPDIPAGGIAAWFHTRSGERPRADGIAGAIRTDKWASGNYIWLGVLCQHGTSPFDENNWLSNLAYAPFTFQR